MRFMNLSDCVTFFLDIDKIEANFLKILRDDITPNTITEHLKHFVSDNDARKIGEPFW